MRSADRSRSSGCRSRSSASRRRTSPASTSGARSTSRSRSAPNRLIRGKESSLDRRSTWWLTVMVRLNRSQTLDAGTAVLRGVQPQIREATMPQDWRADDKKTYLSEPFMLSAAATGTSFLRTTYSRPLLTIMVVVGLVLLIACANIANLLLARATARRHELSVRLALGATRLRLARQLLAESLLLSIVGAALGLAFAQWFSRLLVRQLSTATNNVFLELSLDWRILAFTTAVAIATAVLFGTVPALRATRVQPHDAIKEHGRGAGGHGRFILGNAARRRAGRALADSDRRGRPVHADVCEAGQPGSRIRSRADPGGIDQRATAAAREQRAARPVPAAAGRGRSGAWRRKRRRVGRHAHQRQPVGLSPRAARRPTDPGHGSATCT